MSKLIYTSPPDKIYYDGDALVLNPTTDPYQYTLYVKNKNKKRQNDHDELYMGRLYFQKTKNGYKLIIVDSPRLQLSLVERHVIDNAYDSLKLLFDEIEEVAISSGYVDGLLRWYNE